jgi:tRNA(adenine34) deaminase
VYPIRTKTLRALRALAVQFFFRKREYVGAKRKFEMIPSHETFMALALEEAKKAGQIGEVPIGAVLVAENWEILSAAYNQTIKLADPTAHAEILALRQAASEICNYRLLNTTLFITVEPCIMCMGAMVHARVARVVFGASDPKWGAAGSLYNFAQDERLNHRVEIVKHVLEEDCRKLMQDFFRAKRTGQ